MSTQLNYRLDLLVSGYVREVEEQETRQIIPLEINDIICLFHKVCDEWDRIYSSKDIIIDEGRSLMMINTNGTPTAYGTKIVSSGIFKWRIKMLSWHKVNRNAPPFVGIIEDNDYQLIKYQNTYGWSYSSAYYGYELCAATGSLYLADSDNHYRTKHYKCKWNKQGDILQITLNLNDRTVSFKVNDVDYGVAFGNIKVAKYRLIITFSGNKYSKFAFLG